MERIGQNNEKIGTEEIPVLINLVALARYDSSPNFPIQMMTMGRLTPLKGDRAVLQYDEDLEDPDTGETSRAKVRLLLSPNRVTMIRTGDYENTMVFAPGQRYEGPYTTPYGEMQMALMAKEVTCRAGAEKGSVHLKYDIHFQGAYASTNELHLAYSTDTARGYTGDAGTVT